MLTPYQQHVHRWSDCERCPLHAGRTSVVLARGKLPCDVLFVGEAPGASEDAIGQPFVGPAGQLLDQIIAEGMRANGTVELRLAFTNLVACIPMEDGYKTGEPEPACIKACQPRLLEFVKLARPKGIVLVGELAEKNFPKEAARSVEHYAKIVHPAAILRANYAMQSIMRQRCVVALQGLVERLIGGEDIPF